MRARSRRRDAVVVALLTRSSDPPPVTTIELADDAAASSVPTTIPLPNIDLTVPDWIKAIVKSKPHWLPILIGTFLAGVELKRRKRRNVERDDRAGDAARPGTGTSQ